MHRTSMLRALGLAATFFAVTRLASAATPTPTPSPSATPVVTIARVVTSDRFAERLPNAARTTFVVTHAQLVRNGYQTIAQALQDVPGVSVESYGPVGSFAQIGIRGSSSSQVLVLLNGVPLPGGQIDSLNLNEIPTNGIRRIEVVEGGGSTLYGSGSIGGVINIITSDHGPASAQAGVGSFGSRSLQISSPIFSFARSIAANNYGLPDGTVRPNDDAANTSAQLSYGRRIGSLQARLTAGYIQQTLGVPGSDLFGPLSLTSRENDRMRNAHLSLAHRSKNAVTTLDLSGAAYDLAYTCNTPVDSTCYNAPSTTPFAQLLFDRRLETNIRNVVKNGRGRMIYGVDLARGTARIDDGFGDISTYPYAQSAAYVERDWRSIRGNSLYLGLRGERDGAVGGAFSPSIGGIVRLSNALALKANAATAFRAPTVEDLYYPGFSNPNLVPERTTVGDLTLAGKSPSADVSLGWFETSGKNLIVLDQNFLPQNIGRALIAGFTLDAHTHPFHHFVTRLNLTDLYRAQNLTTGLRIPNRGPVVQTNLSVVYLGAPNARIDAIGVRFHEEGARSPYNATIPYFEQASEYGRVDAYIRARLSKHLIASLRGYNLGNDRYAEILGYPMPGRSFALELGIR
ncbi:MAG: TonB-dependent receptor plug domain-containing protein [Vulcanimicrobiaceae bacterium]